MSLYFNPKGGVNIKKLKLLVMLLVLSFAAVGICQDKPTKTYYNNKVPYARLFDNYKIKQMKVQSVSRGRKVQAEIPVVNDAEKDATQTKGD